MEYKDYYKTLEVDKSASQEAIKKAYRRLARKYHPDFNKGNKLAEQRFKEINEAYQVLGDEGKRKKYDQLGADWEKYKDFDGAGFDGTTFMHDFSRFGAGPRAGGAQRPGGAKGRSGNFSDFFRAFFGNFDLFDSPKGAATDPFARRPHRRSGAAAQAGENTTEAAITIQESMKGIRKRIILKREVWCPQCGGKGASGTGVCPRCLGKGAVASPETIDVNIPPGVQSGSRVRLKGKGSPGVDGKPGDLYLVIKVQPDPVFSLVGRDIHMELPLTVTEAVLGAEIDCPTAAGKVRMRIPPETQNGQVFRLKGKGLPALGAHPAGDQIATVRIVLPRLLTAREKELYTQLAALRRDDPRKGF